MAITKTKKGEIIDNLKNNVIKSESVVFVNFHQLPVKEASEIRRSLKKEEVGYVVAKKTLLKKVLAESGVKGEIPELAGELATAYLTKEGDVLAPARAVYGFQKKMEGKISILGGIFGGEYKNKDEMISIASIPSLNVLRGMFVNIINSPIQRLAVVLGQIAERK